MKVYGKEQSAYCYENSDVLINLQNKKDQEDLWNFENVETQKQIQKILSSPQLTINQFGISLLIKIHKALFGNVYSWAGQFRTEATSKEGTAFCQPAFIAENLKNVAKHLKKHNNYKGQEFGDFVFNLVSTHATLNVIHPFREGNGRTNRLFLTLLARNNGFDLDYSKFPKELQIEADRMSFEGDNRLLDIM